VAALADILENIERIEAYLAGLNRERSGVMPSDATP
jgi:uncharacterized protein with HEPN domain